MIFVDTNYFLRLIRGDTPDQQKIVKDLFKKGARGEVELFTSPVVIFEIQWVLLSVYKTAKEEIAKILTGIFDLKFVTIEHNEIFREALNIYQNSSVSFIDAFNLVYARCKKAADFKTFDAKLYLLYKKQ